MTARIIDGRKVAEQLRAQVRDGCAEFERAHARKPGLATVLVGDDPASRSYIAGKERAMQTAGMQSFHQHLPADTSQGDLLEAVAGLAANDGVDGILVQLPLPSQIDPAAVIEAIPRAKDVDGFHPCNVGALSTGGPTLAPCTPSGVVHLLDAYDVTLEGATATIVGRSNLVGRPLATLLLNRNATVTVAHSRTRDLAAHTRAADIVVMAVGVPGLLTGDMVRPGATVIDVGVTGTDEGLKGDVDFDSAREVAGLITPVPGGVGPMTIAMLLQNTLDAAWRRAALL